MRLQGSMTMDHRDRMIEQFTHDPDVRVFLMSLKAGGVALNLTAASHVMLMDPWSATYSFPLSNDVLSSCIFASCCGSARFVSCCIVGQPSCDNPVPAQAWGLCVNLPGYAKSLKCKVSVLCAVDTCTGVQ